MAADRALFDGDGYDHLQARLQDLLSLLPKQYRKPSLRVQVALPDPVVNQVLFDFDEFPKKREAARNLVNWRYAKEFQSDPADNVCSFQILGETAGKVSVFCLGVEKPLVDGIVEACSTANHMVHVMDASACYQHNRLHESYEPRPGALVSAAADQCSLSLWDRQRCLRYFRGFWTNSGEDGHLVAARRIARIMKAYGRSAGSFETPNLYFIGRPEDRDSLGPMLEARVGSPLRDLPGAPGEIAGLPEQNLMVAVRRCS